MATIAIESREQRIILRYPEGREDLLITELLRMLAENQITQHQMRAAIEGAIRQREASS